MPPFSPIFLCNLSVEIANQKDQEVKKRRGKMEDQ
jgi:hypothetical protein